MAKLSLKELISKKLKNKKVELSTLKVEDYSLWESFGLETLDLALSGRKHVGAIPYGRIGEISGLQGSGKSFLCYYLMRENQRNGGLSVYIDTEGALDKRFCEMIGIDINDDSKFLYVQENVLETIVNNYVLPIVDATIEVNTDRRILIVIDSVAGTRVQSKVDNEIGAGGYGMEKAKTLSDVMNDITMKLKKANVALVLTNQLRAKVGGMSYDKYTTTGGYAIGFYASWRMRLARIGKIVKTIGGVKHYVGNNVAAEITKNRMSAPGKKINFSILFESGLHVYESWISTLLTYNRIKKSARSYVYEKQDGDAIKFTSKTLGTLLEEDSLLREELYEVLADDLIPKYDMSNVVDLSETSLSNDDGLDDAISEFTKIAQDNSTSEGYELDTTKDTSD